MTLKPFLQTIFRFKKPEEFIELRFFKSDKTPADHVWCSSVDEVVEYVEKNKEGKNCYFGINPRWTRKGTQDAVSSFSTLYIDADFDKKLSEDEIDKLSKDFGILPTAVVKTGHGRQLYYCLDKPYEWHELKPVLLQLISYYQADELKNKDRVFRIPGTSNVKSKPWKKCELLSLNSTRHSLEAIKAALTAKGVTYVKETSTKVTDVTPLSPTIASLGFTRKENRWECGVCPSCGNASLYIYDNNPKVVICSHTGNCKWTSSVVALENRLEKEKKKSEAVFNKEAFVRGVVNQPPAVKVGYPKLDRHYHFRAGTINLIAGRLGTGKSTVLYNITLNAANLYPEENFLLFTYEIPKELVYLRMLTIEYARAAKTLITFDEMEEEVRIGGPRAQFAMKRLERLNNIFVYDDPELPIEQLQEIVLETPNVGAIGIDYLECVKVKDKATEELRVSSISTGLKKFAIRTNSFPIWLLSQLNRAPKERKDSRPQEQDIRYSDKALQDSAIGWGLYDPSSEKSLVPKKKGNEEIEPEEEEEEANPITKLEIIGLKNRYGRKTREVMVLDKASGLLSQQTQRVLPQDEEEEKE